MRTLTIIITALAVTFACTSFNLFAQSDATLTLDRIYSGEFRQEWFTPVQWIENGNAFVRMEPSESWGGYYDLVRYDSKTQDRSLYIAADDIVVDGKEKPVDIESFTLSEDGSLALLFANSSRVWRSNTKGDYYIYNFNTHSIRQIGAEFPSSSLMFAKIASNNEFVAYVHDFNIYTENLASGEISQLTTDGNGDIINGTFDWVYEEEFGCRDGFRISPDNSKIAFWQLDASSIGTFYMINNTDSIYSQLLPVQYPKVGQDPSSCRTGWIDLNTGDLSWIPVPGNPIQHYIPSIQWVDDNMIAIQQLNRLQNHLKVYKYIPGDNQISLVYEEREETWVDLSYPDVTANQWGENKLILVDNNKAFLRLSENDGWRHLYRISFQDGSKKLLTPGNYDVATLYPSDDKYIWFNASPYNSTQRYLYRCNLKGRGDTLRVTPAGYAGINTYNLAPNGKYAFHTHTAALAPSTVRLVELPGHNTLKNIMKNDSFKAKLEGLDLPEVQFASVTTDENIEVDARIILPVNFDSSKKYPVLFHVYGEPWGQVATDNFIGLWNIMMAQKGFVVIDMDNRGTPCLKGSEWRKCIYRKVGVINSRDQAKAAQEILKSDFLDNERVSVWGWSGGGSMTLNLLFRYPEIYHTGIAVAAVSNQLIYDNIYQERYMGLPQNNPEDFIEGSPVTYAENLQGNLLLIHGTADDNVHYQSAEILINELIKKDKQFDFMAYPNRSHGIYEGRNTRKHLYQLITDYLIEHNRK